MIWARGRSELLEDESVNAGDEAVDGVASNRKGDGENEGNLTSPQEAFWNSWVKRMSKFSNWFHGAGRQSGFTSVHLTAGRADQFEARDWRDDGTCDDWPSGSNT